MPRSPSPRAPERTRPRPARVGFTGPSPACPSVGRVSDAPAVLAALISSLAVLTLPGLPLALALRLRGLVLAAGLPLLSLMMIALAAELGHLLGIPWSLASPLVPGLLLAVPALLLRRGAAEAPEDPQHSETSSAAARWWGPAALGGLALGGGALLWRQLRLMGSVDAVSQTYDAVFHLSAVRHVLRAQDASAFVVGGMTSLPGEGSFYPALWHQTVSLAVQLSGQEIVLVTNVVMLLVGCVLWPLGLMALLRTATAAGPLGVFLVGALAGIAPAFPLALMSFGLLLPLLLSLTLLPLVVASAAQVLGLVPAQRRWPVPVRAVLAAASCLTVAAAHPQGVFAAWLLVTPMLLVALARRLLGADRGAPADGRSRLLTVAALPGVLAVVAGGALAWTRLRPPQSSAVWEPNASWGQAIAQTGSLAANATGTVLLLGVLMAAAIAVVLRRSRSRWLVAAWAAGATLGVAGRAAPVGDLRYLLTGPFYSDPFRTSAVAVLLAVPVLALGIDQAVRALEAHRAGGGRPALRAVLPPLLALGLALAVSAPALLAPSTTAFRAQMLAQWRSESLLSADEEALLERLPELVPEGAVIATNPWNGSSLASAIGDREVLTVFMGFQAEPPVHLLNAELDQAQDDPEVCAAAEELGVEYALDFGPEELHGRTATYTGLDEISTSGAAEVVASEGEARLLRLLPCRLPDGSMSG